MSSPGAIVAKPTNLPELLARAISLHGPRPFLGVRTSTAREQSLTFAEFGMAVEHAAARLAAAVPSGSRVLVQGAPGPGFAAVLFAAPRADVILVPLDSRMTQDTVARIAALTEPVAILLGGGATLEPATVPTLAALPVLDLDDIVLPPDPTAVEALAARTTTPPGAPWRSSAPQAPPGTPRASP